MARRRRSRGNPVNWRTSDDITIRDATGDDIALALIIAVPLTGWLIYSIYNKFSSNASDEGTSAS